VKLLKGLLIFIVSLVVTLAVVGLFLPSKARVERSIVIERPASAIFPLINSFKRFNEWSPWYGLDPSAQYTYSSAESGVGASMAWVGNDEVGSGKQIITASEPPARVASDLNFGDMGTSKVEWSLTPDGVGTLVNWSLQTDAGWNLVGRYFNLLLDRFVGADYEKGLAKLKTLAESLPPTDFANADIAIVELSARPILYISTSSTQEMSAISGAYAQAFGMIMAALEAAGARPTGPVMGIDNYWDERGYGFDAAIPVERVDIGIAAPVQAGQSYGGRAVRVRHVGIYDGLLDSQKQGEAYITAHALKSRDRVFTEFVSDPANTPPQELISDIYLPIE